MKTRLNRSITKGHMRWVYTITIMAFFISVMMSFFSDLLLTNSTMLVSFIILMIIILIGIMFDIIGVAVTVADEKPFHSMASDKIKGAPKSLKLIKNASRVSSFCNDVVGDICGIISGSCAALIIIKVGMSYGFENTTIFGMVLSGFVASLTIGGKALGKDIAMNNSKEIVKAVGRMLSFWG